MQYIIDGKRYKAIQNNLYHHTETYIKINHMLSDRFFVRNGIRQGDNLSPTMFSLFVNELAKEIKAMNLRIEIGNRIVSILLYADDVVLLAPREIDLQRLLDKLSIWCM